MMPNARSGRIGRNQNASSTFDRTKYHLPIILSDSIQMEETIDRVDQLIRKNNAKYKDEQSQKAYEQALIQYQRHAKTEIARQYAEAVKEGNRRAVEKARQAKKQKAKNKAKRKAPPVLPVQVEEQKKVELPKKRMSQADVKVVKQTIQARAERIMQQQHLQRLNRKLQQEKKRTKLFELNQKCKKMLSKSHERIVTAKNIPEERMKVLKKLQEKAVGDINQLDCIISNLIHKANANAKTSFIPHIIHSHQQQHSQQNQVHQQDESLPSEPDFDIDLPPNFEGDDNFKDQQNNFLNINTLIFEKSSQELLKMNYIPL